MNIEALREHALAKKGVEEGFPFGESALVFKVKGKMFLLVMIDAIPLQFNVKCEPAKAIELREEYSCVLPGYHMNKRHWNTIIVDGTLSPAHIREMVDHSYDLVAPKKKK